MAARLRFITSEDLLDGKESSLRIRMEKNPIELHWAKTGLLLDWRKVCEEWGKVASGGCLSHHLLATQTGLCGNMKNLLYFEFTTLLQVCGADSTQFRKSSAPLQVCAIHCISSSVYFRWNLHLFVFTFGSTVLNEDRRARERAALAGGDIAGVVAMDVEILRVRPAAMTTE